MIKNFLSALALAGSVISALIAPIPVADAQTNPGVRQVRTGACLSVNGTINGTIGAGGTGTIDLLMTTGTFTGNQSADSTFKCKLWNYTGTGSNVSLPQTAPAGILGAWMNNGSGSLNFLPQGGTLINNAGALALPTGNGGILWGNPDGSYTLLVTSSGGGGGGGVLTFNTRTGNVVLSGADIGAAIGANAPAHQVVTGINASTGALIFAQLACADISDAAASCTTDTRNASNLNAGTVAGARLPALTGDVSMSIGTTVTAIGVNKVTNAMLAQAVANVLKGNPTGSTGNIQDVPVPSCIDVTGNHLNWTPGVGLSCGSSGSGGGVASFNTRTGAVTLTSGDVSGVSGLLGGNNLNDVTSAPQSRINLGIDVGTGHGDSAYTMAAVDRFVYTNAAFTAARIWTLPAASSYSTGEVLYVQDVQGTVTGTNTLTVSRAGSDTINGSASSVVLNAAFSGLAFISDGNSKWTVFAVNWPIVATSHFFITGWNPRTGYTSAQPACSDLSGVAASCATDATNATNIGSGTLAAARLPAFSGGDVTSSAGSAVLTIGANRVVNSMLATAVANTFKANVTNATATPTDASLPSCTDSLGQHLNYTPGTGLSCGTSSSASGVGSVTSGSADLSASPTTGNVVVNNQAAFTLSPTMPYTILSTDVQKTIVVTTAGVITLPDPGTAGFGTGKYLQVLNLSGGIVTVQRQTSGTINGNQSIILQPNGVSCPANAGTTDWKDNCSQVTSAADALTAHSGGGQASALQLSALVNNITTVAVAADSVKLMASYAGAVQIACNSAASNAMQVFGTSPDTINGVATGTGVSQAAGGLCTMYSSPAAGKWVSTPLASSGGITQLTSDVTAGPGSGSQAATIAAGAVTNAKRANMAANTFSSNETAGSAAPADNTLPSCSGSNSALNYTSNSGLGCVTTVARLDTVGVFSASQRVTLQTPTISTATFTPNFDTGADFVIGLTSACPCTIANPSTTPVAGQHGILYIVQDSGGSRTVGTWGSQYITQGGVSTLALSTAANAIDVLSYAVKDATHIVLSPVQTNAVH